MHSPDFLADLFGLQGKTAIVIGGEGVLGGTIATGLACAGARVIVAGIHVENAQHRVLEIRKLGAEAEFQPLDVTRRSDLVACVERLQHEQRTCDILVHAAGVNSATPFLEIGDDEWDRILRVNLTSLRVACQVFGQAMLDAGTRGSIINFASLSGIVPLSRVFTYSVAKAGVLNLTQNLAREWAPRGIRVNALSPGFFPAEQNRKILTPERVSSILGHTPMQRFGEAHELIGATLLLASNTAGGFITGSNVIVDGGFSAMTI